MDLGTSPTWEDTVFATVLATGALIGIEAASGLAGEVRVGPQGPAGGSSSSARSRRGPARAGVSAAALMALPVQSGATALGARFEQAPVLGMVSTLDPEWLRRAARYAVGALGGAILLVAMNGQMLGLSRLAYSLATNRQIPSALGRLHPRRGTPYVAIVIAGADLPSRWRCRTTWTSWPASSPSGR